MLHVKRLTQLATIPTRATPGSAGFDIYAAGDYTLSTGISTIPIGIAIKLPHGTYGQIASRSSLAKRGITISGGVIDSDYRGEINVLILNRSDGFYHIKRGDRIAQLIINVIATMQINEVYELDDTERGEGGFGSTGV